MFQMWRLTWVLLLAAAAASLTSAQQFKRMPELRGQSFGLENFLLQPFDLMASQAEEPPPPPKRRDRRPSSPYTVEFQVQNDDFDMRKLVPTAPRAPILFTHDRTKPVHEPEELPPPPRRRQSSEANAGKVSYDSLAKATLPLPDTRRPLEKPSEFTVSLTEDIPFPQEDARLERPRKRVMKRRRKKPSTTQPEVTQETSKRDQLTVEGETIFDEAETPTSYQQTVQDTSPPVIPSEGVADTRPPRRKQGGYKRQREPTLTEESASRYDDIFTSEGSQKVPYPDSPSHKERETTTEPPAVTQIPNEPTQHLKNLLKQQNGQLSLSEILQTQNLSLADFLKGNPGALSALGANKVSVDEPTTPQQEPESEKPKPEYTRPHIPKISPKSRPFSKPFGNGTKIARKPITTTEEPTPDLPKKLQIIEVTSDRPTYNGFTPKNPRSRGGQKAENRKKLNDNQSDSLKNKATTEPDQELRPRGDQKTEKTSTHHRENLDEHSLEGSKNRATTEKDENLRSRGDQKMENIPIHYREKLDEHKLESLNDRVPAEPEQHTAENENESKQVTTEKEEKETGQVKIEGENESKKAKVEKEEKEINDEREYEMMRTTAKSPVYRLTTLPQLREATIAERRLVPKRYGEHRPKVRLDRRKPTTDATTEMSTLPDELGTDTTIKTSSTTEHVRTTKEPRNRVRIPFMSVNNPEISVILPHKKANVTTEKPRTSPVIKDRINLFKRLNEEKQPNENTVQVKEADSAEATPTTHPASSTTTHTTHAPTTEDEMDGSESSDEIVELLKSGNNAQRLHRILEARNMTVNELLEKRANSSKQPNVTKLFERQRDSTDSQLSGKHKVTELQDNFHPSSEKSPTVLTKKTPVLPVFPEFPNFKIEHGEKIKVKSDLSKPHDSNGFDELFVDESVIRPIKLPFDQDETREPKAYPRPPIKENIHKTGHRVHLNLSPGSEGKAKHPMPLWNVDEKSIYSSNPYGYPTYDLNNNLAGTRATTTPQPEQDIILLETISRSLDSNHRLKTNINDILKEQVEQVEVVKEVRDDVTFIPPAVKSAIIASGVVMGIALLLFVAIFAACGWKQRQFRLRARSSILNDSLNGSAGKTIRRTGTLSPVSFKRSSLYKKSIDFEDTESSISGSSNTSSYLWNTLKHTFQSRNSTLKNRQEKEEKIQERENRSRRNTLSREDERGRRTTLSRDDSRRDSAMTRDDVRRDSIMTRDDVRRESVMTRDVEMPRRNTLNRDELLRDSINSRDAMSRDIMRDAMPRELTREDSRRASCFRDDTSRRLSSLLRENERCSFKKIDPDRNIIQTSVNFKRGGFNGSSRHFDSCDHFN